MAAVVPAADEGADLGIEVAHGAEGAAVNGLALDDAEPDLDEVHPGGMRRGEVDLEAGAWSAIP